MVNIICHCPDYLCHHPLFKCYGSSLFAQSEKDYPGYGFFTGYEIPTIDLDLYEKNLHLNPDCTSDSVVAIADVSESSITNQRLLLTELRMGYKNERNLNFSNLKQKYSHSRDILYSLEPQIRIDSKFALIFTKSLESKAKNWIRRWRNESSKKEACNWDTYYPESFCNYINYGKDIPLVPSKETKLLISRWCNKTTLCFEELETISEEIQNYWWKIKGKRQTADQKHISQCITSFLSSIKFPPEEDIDLCILLKKEMLEIISSLD